MDWFRSIASALLGIKWVRLIDHDGETTVCRVRFAGGRPFAERMGFGVRPVTLLDNGKVENGCYVDRWEPYDPRAKKRLPSWEPSNE